MSVEICAVKLAQVAIPLPVQDPFSYVLADGFHERACVGSRVLVPFKNREIQGYIVALEEAPAWDKLKPVKELIDEEPLLDEPFLELTRWMSRYYFCSWGEAIENGLPKWVRMRKDLRVAKGGPPEEGDSPPAVVPNFDLNAEQTAVLSSITGSLARGGHETILLHGVTGSGKTEVYIRAIKTVLSLGKGAVCLVPEIALTHQIQQFFSGHFPGLLEVIHSRLTDRQRFEAWKRIRSGQTRVVLGPRSALFAPLPNLGLIILDEEHESSYKQAEVPRYHARDVARKRGELEGALVLLGSATPALETMHEAREGKILLHQLAKRVDDRPLPEVHVIDLKRELETHKKRMMFSFPLSERVTRALEAHEGVLILLNRRGFATQVQCQACGEIVRCRHCDVALTYHQEKRVLICHYCNFQVHTAEACPSCSAHALKYVGWGTEKIESETARLFPEARVSRLDTDVARRKGMHEKVIREFREGKTDILVGTQMIAKGFDFPQVTLVGVVSADVGLALPDFRSSERTFQLLTQVAGRAGRGARKGQVVIQTFSPHHHAVACARRHDYAGFFEIEMEKRRELGYPPFNHLVNLIMQGKDEKAVYQFALVLKDSLKGKGENASALLGPAPLPFYRLRGQYRWHLMLKGKEVLALNEWLKQALGSVKRPSRVKLIVDVDPVSVL